MSRTAVSVDEARCLLGLTSEADEMEVTRAYRRRARSIHPDLNARADAAACFQALTDAYRVALGAAHPLPSTGAGRVPADAAPTAVEVEVDDAGGGAVHHDPPVFLTDITGRGSAAASGPSPSVAPVTAGPVIVRPSRAGGAGSRGSDGAWR